jgi:hypothetical protein
MRPTSRSRLWVGNLRRDLTDLEFWDFFVGEGLEPSTAKVCARPGQATAYGFVGFHNHEHFRRCFGLHGCSAIICPRGRALSLKYSFDERGEEATPAPYVPRLVPPPPKHVPPPAAAPTTTTSAPTAPIRLALSTKAPMPTKAPATSKPIPSSCSQKIVPPWRRVDDEEDSRGSQLRATVPWANPVEVHRMGCEPIKLCMTKKGLRPKRKVRATSGFCLVAQQNGVPNGNKQNEKSNENITNIRNMSIINGKYKQKKWTTQTVSSGPTPIPKLKERTNPIVVIRNIGACLNFNIKHMKTKQKNRGRVWNILSRFPPSGFESLATIKTYQHAILFCMNL